MNQIENGWFLEKSDVFPGHAFALQVKEVLYSGKSKFQDVLVFESETFGKVLVLDGIIQCTERDEFSYQEMITFLALNSHHNPKSVLIIGGGDGGVAREVVKHPAVEKVIQCEIDEDVVTVSKKYLPFMAVGLDDPKVELKIGDAFEYIGTQHEAFDVIISDTSDPEGPAEMLFSKSFYEKMHHALLPGGIICNQGECQWIDSECIKSFVGYCKSTFQTCAYAFTTTPSYTTGQIGFILGCKDKDVDFTKPKWVFTEEQKTAMKLRYYDENVHQAAFSLPRFMKKMHCTEAIIVDGIWSNWMDNLSSCSTTCGPGTRTQTRTCLMSECNDGICAGEMLKTIDCNEQDCYSVDGDWSSWMVSGSCSVTCGGGQITEVRSRDSPEPINGGSSCIGDAERTVTCNEEGCPVDGDWSSWMVSGSCSVTCEEGRITEVRSCDSPEPINGGSSCIGDAERTVTCNEEGCPVDGDWSSWMVSGSCSVTCEEGRITEVRSCDSPEPTNGGSSCIGDAERTVTCNEDGCPVTQPLELEVKYSSSQNVDFQQAKSECETKGLTILTFDPNNIPAIVHGIESKSRYWFMCTESAVHSACQCQQHDESYFKQFTKTVTCQETPSKKYLVACI